MRKHIPNALTLLNLSSGFTAILFLATGHVHPAVYLVMVAAVFDFLDGFAARLLGAYSGLGKQLDSLADMVSFGVVPALVLFHEILFVTGKQFPASFPEMIFILSPVLIVLAAGLRLGRFNISEQVSTAFTGLATPAMALFMISLPLVRETEYFHGYAGWLKHPSALAIIAFLFSWLMISRIPMFSLKFENFGFRKNVLIYLFLGLSLLLFLLFSFSSLFLIIILYIFIALIKGVATGKNA